MPLQFFNNSSINFFDDTANVYINTVNCVGVMGNGIALEFRNRYPEMYEYYSILCSHKAINIGSISSFTTRDNKTIINLPTKKHWRNPSKYSYVLLGLIDLEDELHSINKDCTIHMPAIGCGLGELRWDIVKVLICEVLQNVTQLIKVFPPH